MLNGVSSVASSIGAVQVRRNTGSRGLVELDADGVFPTLVFLKAVEALVRRRCFDGHKASNCVARFRLRKLQT